MPTDLSPADLAARLRMPFGAPSTCSDFLERYGPDLAAHLERLAALKARIAEDVRAEVKRVIASAAPADVEMKIAAAYLLGHEKAELSG